MSKASRLIVILALGCAGLAACASQQPSPPAPPAATQSATISPTSTSANATPTTPKGTTEAPGAPTSTPDCVGLSICPPPPPDAEGNPACYFSDGWQATASGDGIEVWYFHEPQYLSNPDRITVEVRKKDGTSESQEADIEAGQQVHRFEFPGIAEPAVQQVLLTSSTGRCFVIGPGG